jgi:acyl-CoA thioesterase I
MESGCAPDMARRRVIKKSKEVQKMKRGARSAVAVAAGILLAAAVPCVNQAVAREPVIVAFGNSLTAGLGLPENDAFPAQLEKALRARGQEVKVVNAGVSGDTAAAGLARLDWAMPDDASAVIIELGANDALQGLDPAATKATLEKIITDLKARGLSILLAGMEAPRNLGKDYVDRFRAIYEDLAKRYDLVFYPFFLDGVVLDDKYMQNDGLHPNAEGVARIVDGILPKVEELLARTTIKG